MVEGRRVVTPGFPTVVPGAGGDEDAGARDWRGGFGEVGDGGKEVVGVREVGALEGGGDEVCGGEWLVGSV